MAEITITVDREELINDLHHLGNGINSIGALGYDGETFHKHARELSEDYVKVLQANTPLKVAEEPSITEEEELIIGYVATHKLGGDVLFSTFSMTSDHTHARLLLCRPAEVINQYKIIPLKRADL